MNIDTYLADRVDYQLSYYESEANKAKKIHIKTQNTIIILGLLVPVVVNLPAEWGGGFDARLYIQISVTVMSLLLAILNGLSNFRKYGDLWLSYRMTEELIKHEKFLFLTSSGEYDEAETASQKFVERIESIISSEHTRFRSLLEEARRPTATKKPETDTL